MSKNRRSHKMNTSLTQLVTSTVRRAWQQMTDWQQSNSTATAPQRPQLPSAWMKKLGWKSSLISSAAMLAFGVPTLTHGQTPPDPGYSIGFGDEANDGSYVFEESSDLPDFYTIPQQTQAGPSNSARSFGWNVKAGHMAGQTYGREESITYIQTMPYAFYEESMFFGDLRFSRTNDGFFSGMIGAGFKFYSLELERTFGGAWYYDRDDTTGSIFEQYVISLESLGENFDWRGNYYMPNGTRRNDIGITLLPSTIEFQNNNIVFDQIRTVGLSLEGFDTEIGVPLRYGWMGEHNSRIYAGTYMFQHPEIEDIWGGKGRLETWLTPNIDLDLEISHDSQFDTTVQFNASFFFDSYEGIKGDGVRSTWERMTLPIERLQTVAVARVDQLEVDQLAINPDTNAAYEVRHVRSGVVGPGTGAVDDPFRTIEDARVAAGTFDIIYVHGNSTFGGADAMFNINANTRVLGEGMAIDRANGQLVEVDHIIPEASFGQIIVPKVFTGADRPVLTGIVGDAVTMADNSEFSGFVIGDSATNTNGATGRGIVIDTITTTSNDFVDLYGIDQEGLYIVDADGQINFDNLLINNPGGNAFFYTDTAVNGGQRPIITMTLSEIINDSGYSVLIENTETGILNMGTSSITETDGQGIRIVHDPGLPGSVITLDNIDITRTAASADAGIEIDGGGSLITFRNTNGAPTSISGAGDGATNSGAVYIHDTEAGSNIQFTDLTIDDRRSYGINMERVGGQANFQGATIIQDHILGTDAGISFQESTGAVTFNTILIEESNGIGIEIGELATDNSNASIFLVEGITTFSGGTGTNDASIFITDDNSRVTFNGITDNNRNDEGIEVVSNRGTIFFSGISQFNNVGDQSDESAIRLFENTGNVTFSTIDIVNQDTASGVFIDYQTAGLQYGAINLGAVSVEADGTEAIFARGINTSLSASGGVLDVSDATAIDIETSDVDEDLLDLNLTLESVSVDDTPDFGIRLVNLTGQFIIEGDGTVDSGGTFDIGTAGTTAILVDNSGLVTDAIADGDDPQDVLDLFDVELNSMLFDGVEIGVVGDTLDTFTINNTLFDSTVFESILMTDVLNLNVINNEFDSVGTSGAGTIIPEDPTQVNAINVVYTRVLEDGAFYNVGIQNNLIDLDADGVFIGTAAGVTDNDSNNDIPDGDQPNVNILFDNNVVTTNVADGTDEVVFESVLEGTVALTFTNNTIDRDGDADVVILTTESDTEGLIYNIQNNVIRGTDSFANSALNITAEGDALINIFDNQFSMEGFANEVLAFTLTGTSVVNIDTNIIAELTDDGTGILFNRVEEPFALNLDNNVINLADAANDGIETGILFQQVVGTATLSSTENNLVNFGSPFVIRLPDDVFQINGASQGFVIINGLTFP